MQAPLDVTVLRSGIPDTLPGRSINVGERGIAAVLSGELTPGESVGLEVHLPSIASPLRIRALVRHYERLRCGMEFVGLAAAQQEVIREWAELSKAPAESDTSTSGEDGEDGGASKPNASQSPPAGPHRKHRKILWIMLLIAAALLAAGFWWHWNRGWEELESGLSRPVSNAENRVRVPAEVMEKRLVHRVDPEYPVAARPAKLEGIVLLDVVIGPDGSVVQMRPLSGPEVLSRAAMEALRWWKFQPYRANGQAVEVETTVAVEFKSPVITGQ